MKRLHSSNLGFLEKAQGLVRILRKYTASLPRRKESTGAS